MSEVGLGGVWAPAPGVSDGLTYVEWIDGVGENANGFAPWPASGVRSIGFSVVPSGDVFTVGSLDFRAEYGLRGGTALLVSSSAE